MPFFWIFGFDSVPEPHFLHKLCSLYRAFLAAYHDTHQNTPVPFARQQAVQVTSSQAVSWGTSDGQIVAVVQSQQAERMFSKQRFQYVPVPMDFPSASA